MGLESISIPNFSNSLSAFQDALMVSKKDAMNLNCEKEKWARTNNGSVNNLKVSSYILRIYEFHQVLPALRDPITVTAVLLSTMIL